MRRLTRTALALPFLLAPALLVAASAQVQPLAEPLETALARSIAEARTAEAEVRKLEQAAREASTEAERLRARQAAAAEAIAAAEARISAADAQARLTAAQIEARRQRLAEQQAPAGALLAGLALMAERPPLLAILDHGSTEELVRVRLLLDSTLPAIRKRTAALSRDLEQGRQLHLAAEQARAALVRSRNELAERRRQFAALEEQAIRRAELQQEQAIGAGDVALARSEEAAQLSRQAERGRAAAQIAAALAADAAPPPRPVPAEGGRQPPALAYRLPALAPITEGFGSVGPNGIRSRGLTLATGRGVPLAVPASGIVRFSGPFRSYDGIVIIDHGQGWMSLIINVSSPLKPGTRVHIGEPLGRALGAIGVELSRNGHRTSPALIAGSYENLSNRGKDG